MLVFILFFLKTLQLTGKVMFRVISVAQAPIEGNRGWFGGELGRSVLFLTSQSPNSSPGVAASFAIHDLPFAPNITAWVGGAIYGALEGLATRSVTQDAFRQNQKLPDWAVIPDPPPAPKPEGEIWYWEVHEFELKHSPPYFFQTRKTTADRQTLRWQQQPHPSS